MLRQGASAYFELQPAAILVWWSVALHVLVFCLLFTFQVDWWVRGGAVAVWLLSGYWQWRFWQQMRVIVGLQIQDNQLVFTDKQNNSTSIAVGLGAGAGVREIFLTRFLVALMFRKPRALAIPSSLILIRQSFKDEDAFRQLRILLRQLPLGGVSSDGR
ncbi:hypothetical protein [Teredinibacter franksiae]|jgi:hypothetical protein|uniref:hypothetical protein n=1 Tax=Teredinibacter franksiae TaxID=2761453 RepID=UPI001626DF56|nr:hypothetical protein [Teredinibacter franksiae]